MRVAYFQRTRLPQDIEESLNATYYGSLKELLGAADVVSLNCPLNEKTRGMIGKEQFSWMKNGAFLVNTARGAIIDENALIDALESGKVERAGMDVFIGEPKPK
jgi:lactate dehydrogenase-like 2-hydroxyacid dehydrogenase